MKYVVVGMSLGLCFVAAWGAALQNVALGVALGVPLPPLAWCLADPARRRPARRWHLTSRRPIRWVCKKG